MRCHPLATLPFLLTFALLPAACGEGTPSDGGAGHAGEGGAGGDTNPTGPGGSGGSGGSGPLADPAAPLFAGTSIPRFEITMTQESLDELSATPYEYVKGDLTVELDGETIALQNIGVRIKGRAGSFRSLDQKTAFLLKFDKFTKKQRFLGLEKLAINNMVQDPSMIHERVGYPLFHAMDVPAPRSAHATLHVNGEPFGLYAPVESTDNPGFLNTWFGSDKGNLYEGEYGSDLFVGLEGSFDQDNGDDIGFADLTELAQALDGMTNPDTFLTDVAPHIDVDEYLRFAATELYIGHWDGYANWRNNYFIYRRPSDDRWLFIPWGIDQTFSDHLDPFAAYGRIQEMCVASTPCRQRLAQTYEEVIARAAELDLVAQATALEPFLWDAVLDDHRKEVSDDAVASSIAATIHFLRNRPDSVQERLVCVDPSAIDADQDGFSGCGEDCNDNDPSVYPGAPEQCNLRDDDCDGVWDNDPSCPQCVTEAAPGGGTLAFCFQPRTWAAAEADCVAQGGHLISLHDQATRNLVVSRVNTIGGGTWWIGLHDQAQEGTFVWTDGSPLDYTDWASGEPNNYADDEHCVHLTGGGQWNDLFCTSDGRYVCRLP
ncbi:CotH kinase family protein [Chondromyces crocatus]|uniref:Lectin C-type domain protein n=1 Tax=Chondromyces crocatus TaxID=52 RepID=A0A0K1EAI6_CHOCO|nr:CotH kinase family protein [Chondromyces crocatus]AKT37573.1 lectin C-type domain protein [Chondromyces crocatus]